MKKMEKIPMVFLAGLLLLGTVLAAGETIDMNSVAIGSSGAKTTSANYVTWISAEENAVGTVSSVDFNVNLGFAYDIMGPETTAVQGADYNVLFTCTDDESNCKTLSYNLYDVNHFVEWSAPGAIIGVQITVDGNHAIFYYSSDDSDNNETGKITYGYKPAPTPHTTGSYPRTGPSRPLEPELEELFELDNFFVQLADPSIPVLDGTEKDPGLREKRFAGPNEIVMLRSIKAFALVGEMGTVQYQYKVILEIENISGRKLYGIEVIEAIPENIVENASMVESNAKYEVIEQEPPILRFLFGDLESWEKESIEYDFNRTAEQGPVSEEMFNEMTSPTALIELRPDDKCLGVTCNDFNPCTRDYCVVDECVYAPMKERAKCGDGMVCMKGICIGKKLPVGQTGLLDILATNFDMVVVILLFGAVAIGFTIQFTTSRFLKKKKVKKEIKKGKNSKNTEKTQKNKKHGKRGKKPKKKKHKKKKNKR